MIASPASGPSAIATATARLSSTTGDGNISLQHAVERRRSRPSRCRPRSARSRGTPRSRLAFGTARARRAAARRRAARRRLVDGVVVPAANGLASSSGTRFAGVIDAACSRRASCSSISASRPEHFGLVGHQLGERARRAGSLPRTSSRRTRSAPAVARVALVEEQIEHGEHRVRALGQQVRRRHAIGDAGIADLVLGAHEPLRHRRFGYEEGARDLGRRQTRERAQRERDLRLDRERRVTTREDQPEAIVFDATVVARRWIVGAGRTSPPPAVSAAPRRRAAQPVDRAVARGRREPGAGVARDAVTGPSFEGLREGVLRAFLGEIPVAGRCG